MRACGPRPYPLQAFTAWGCMTARRGTGKLLWGRKQNQKKTWRGRKLCKGKRGGRLRGCSLPYPFSAWRSCSTCGQVPCVSWPPRHRRLMAALCAAAFGLVPAPLWPSKAALSTAGSPPGSRALPSWAARLWGWVLFFSAQHRWLAAGPFLGTDAASYPGPTQPGTH